MTVTNPQVENPSPLHSLLLRHTPTNSAKVQYKPKPFHRRRPRTLHHYPDGTLVIYNDQKHRVDRVISPSDDKLTTCGTSRIIFGNLGSYVKLAKQNNVREFIGSDTAERVEDDAGRGWRFMKKVGGGSGGSVWMVENGREGGIMGVKVVEKEGMCEGENTLRRVVEERRAMELVEGIGSEFVVGLQGAWQSERRLYLGMRWFGYGDLGRVVRGRRVGEEVVKGVVGEIVLGLEELRELGFVHRDLKVENVFVDENGHVAVGDLGMAKFVGRGSEEEGVVGRTRSFVGTRSSMAPEMLMGKSYSYSVDMWALGVLIYRLLTGRMPFGRGSYKENGGQVGSSIALFHEIKTSPIKYPDYLSEEAKDLLKGLFDRYVGDRFDLKEVKNHKWFEGMNWEEIKESARMQIPVPYFDEFIGDVKPLDHIDDSDDTSNYGAGHFVSKITLSELGDRDEYTPQSSKKERKSSKLSPWASGKLFFSNNKFSGKSAAGAKRKAKKGKNEQRYVKIWGYDYRAPSTVSSVSSSPFPSRRESKV